MKKLLFVFFSCFSICVIAQDLSGSWKLIEENGTPVEEKEVFKIYQDGYFAVGAKEKNTNKFLYAYGGTFLANDHLHTTILDFHSKNSGLINRKIESRIILNGIMLHIFKRSGGKEVWRKISSEANELTGNWVITGRERDGTMNTIKPGDRRTIKILSGDRFQWVAFNSKTKEFFATGGGTYIAKDGVYTENIDFFSKDNDRVGAKLHFEYELQNGHWHHKGKSSKGNSIFEIWSPYQEAYSN